MSQEQYENNVENVENVQTTEPPKRRAPIVIGGRNAMIKAIKGNAERIVDVGGHPLLTARQVLEVMKSEKLLPSLVLSEIRSANGVGDALGFKHLNLPFILRGTKRAYLVQAAAWTHEEKRAFDQKPSEEQDAVIVEMIGEFPLRQEA